MDFKYNSSQIPTVKILNPEIVRDVRKFLYDKLGDNIDDLTYGEIHQAFLSYRRPNGNILMINQLEPLYTYFCLNGYWPEEEGLV